MQLNHNTDLFYDCLNSPVGWLKIVASPMGITAIDFDAEECSQQAAQPNAHTDLCRLQLQQYFTQKLTSFSVPLDLSGTPFQLNVWQALQTIPYGQTCSYLDVALAINNAKAVRAVGAANGRNPVPIIVPCHRVIGRDGSLVGFSGGMNKKIWLLEHEDALGKQFTPTQELLF